LGQDLDLGAIVNLKHVFGLYLIFVSVFATAASPSVLIRNLGTEPVNIHPFQYLDVAGETVLTEYICDGLLGNDPNTWDPTLRLAEQYEWSKDKKTLTFKIRKDAVFHDGSDVTAEDVKFSFEAIKIPEVGAGEKVLYLDGISNVEVLNEKTVAFHLSSTYFQNLNRIGAQLIVPKHIYQNISKIKEMLFSPVCAGPYAIEKYEKGKKISLKKFDKWYGLNKKEFSREAQFDLVQFRFIRDAAEEFAALNKGEIDISQWPLSIDNWMKFEVAPPDGGKITKLEIGNLGPRSFGVYGMNFLNPLFEDKRVRLALYHLMNRDLMNKKFRFGKSALATGPFSLFSEVADSEVKPILFNEAETAKILKKVGWSDTDGDGILDKKINGKKVQFKFILSYAHRDSEKYHLQFKEDLQKAGIQVDLKFLDWNSFVKSLDAKNFEMISMSWGGAQEWDPKLVWHSDSIEGRGSNYISYRNKKVDRLIDEARLIVDKSKRIEKMKKIYRLIAEDVPYLFWFNNKYDYFIVSNRILGPAEQLKREIGFRYFSPNPAYSGSSK
jgi:microcin C transport system substrate-binding protein